MDDHPSTKGIEEAVARAQAAGTLLATMAHVWDVAPQSNVMMDMGGTGFFCAGFAKGAPTGHKLVQAEHLLVQAKDWAYTAFGRAQSPDRHGLHLDHSVNGLHVLPFWAGPHQNLFGPSAKGAERHDWEGIAAALGAWAGLMGAPGWGTCRHPRGELWCPSPEAAAFLVAMADKQGRHPHGRDNLVAATRACADVWFDGQRHDTQQAYATVDLCAQAGSEAFVRARPSPLRAV